MLFLIHLLGGLYCQMQLDGCKTLKLENVVMCIFFGWIFIVLYIIKLCAQSADVSSGNGSGTSSYTKSRHNNIMSSYDYDQEYYYNEESDDDFRGWTHADLCDYYGCGEDDWPD